MIVHLRPHAHSVPFPVPLYVFHPSMLPSMLLSVHPVSRHSEGGGKVIYSLFQDTASTSIYSTPTLFWRPHQYQAGAWVVISSICKCLVRSEMTRTMERHTNTSSTVYRDIKNPTHYRIPLTHTLHTKRGKWSLIYSMIKISLSVCNLCCVLCCKS